MTEKFFILCTPEPFNAPQWVPVMAKNIEEAMNANLQHRISAILPEWLYRQHKGGVTGNGVFRELAEAQLQGRRITRSRKQ